MTDEERVELLLEIYFDLKLFELRPKCVADMGDVRPSIFHGPESKTNNSGATLFQPFQKVFPDFSRESVTVHAEIKTCQIDKCLELENLHEFAR